MPLVSCRQLATPCRIVDITCNGTENVDETEISTSGNLDFELTTTNITEAERLAAIDGSPLSTSFILRTATTVMVPIVIKVGWTKITVTIAMVITLINLITMDLVYPWDIVIDNDTVEYARFGSKYPYLP